MVTNNMFDDSDDCPVEVGERLVVQGRPEKAIVRNVEWSDGESRWKITLDWGIHGRSTVWSTDENKVWVKYAKIN